MREYLQARILEGLQRAGAMSPLAFQGGTALRFLYRLPRYSEDLDFTLEGPRESYDPRRWLTSIAAQFRRERATTRPLRCATPMPSTPGGSASGDFPTSSTCRATATRR